MKYCQFGCLCQCEILLQSDRRMIHIKIKGVNLIEGVQNQMEIQYPLDKRCVWIGRGEEIHQKQNTSNYVINLANLSKAISRIHACLILSPSFFYKEHNVYPSYFDKLGKKWKVLPSNILYQIWQYAQPTKRILLKDMHSKTGIFKKQTCCLVEAGMQIVLGDSRPLIFHNQQIHDSHYQMSIRLDELKLKGYVVINQNFEAPPVLSFWIISFKNQYFILLNRPSPRILIGRSSDCSIIISQASISRKHAHLSFAHQKWRLIDGDGVNVSSNGMWRKTRKIWIDFRGKDSKMSGGQSIAKIGDILFTLTIKQQHSLLNLQECISFNRSTDGSFNELLRKELSYDEMPQLIKNSNKF